METTLLQESASSLADDFSEDYVVDSESEVFSEDLFAAEDELDDDEDHSDALVVPRKMLCWRCQLHRVIWSRCGLHFSSAAAEDEFRRRNVNTRRYYTFFIIGGIALLATKMGLAVGFLADMPEGQITANLGDYAFILALAISLGIALANRFCERTRSMWSLTVPLFLSAQIIDFCTTLYDYSTPGFYDQLHNYTTFGIGDSCQSVEIINGVFGYPAETNLSDLIVNSSYCDMTELLGVAGFIAGVGEIAQMNQNWEFAAIIVALAVPFAEVAWLLPLPWATMCTKIILLYFPPPSVSSMMFRQDITTKVLGCFTIWIIAFVSFAAQLLASIRI